MADAELVSSPLVTDDGGAASTVPPSTTEGTAALTTTGVENVSIEASEETPEARVLAQGPYNYTISYFCYH
jgi:hypothetical protein